MCWHLWGVIKFHRQYLQTSSRKHGQFLQLIFEKNDDKYPTCCAASENCKMGDWASCLVQQQQVLGLGWCQDGWPKTWEKNYFAGIYSSVHHWASRKVLWWDRRINWEFFGQFEWESSSERRDQTFYSAWKDHSKKINWRRACQEWKWVLVRPNRWKILRGKWEEKNWNGDWVGR